MNTYTIQDLYNQAHALIQNYGLAESERTLEVSFRLSVEPKSGKLATVFVISYRKSVGLDIIETEDQANDFLSKRSMYGDGYSPALALADFESALIELSFEFPSYVFSFYPEPD